MDERTIYVNKEFFSKLLECLQPEERFIEPHEKGLVLYVPYIHRKLIFSIRKDLDAKTKEVNSK